MARREFPRVASNSYEQQEGKCLSVVIFGSGSARQHIFIARNGLGLNGSSVNSDAFIKVTKVKSKSDCDL